MKTQKTLFIKNKNIACNAVYLANNNVMLAPTDKKTTFKVITEETEKENIYPKCFTDDETVNVQMKNLCSLCNMKPFEPKNGGYKGRVKRKAVIEFYNVNDYRVHMYAPLELIKSEVVKPYDGILTECDTWGINARFEFTRESFNEFYENELLAEEHGFIGKVVKMFK